MLDRITQHLPISSLLQATKASPASVKSSTARSVTSMSTYNRSKDLEALVMRCEASLARLSTLTSSVNIMDKSKVSTTISVNEISNDKSKAYSKRKIVKPTERDSRKWKIGKPLSRTGSGFQSVSTTGSSVSFGCHDITSSPAQCFSPPSIFDISLNDESRTSSSSASSCMDDLTSSIPDDGNICTLLYKADLTSDSALLDSCVSYLGQRAAFHPLIAIKACAPFAFDPPAKPFSMTVHQKVRPILHDAVRTLLDDFPEFDAGQSEEYQDSVPSRLQDLFSYEWCLYVRRIKSFHENTPFDDFDYDHSKTCANKNCCETKTREAVRDAWNAFWRDSILSGNRCVPRPSMVAKFFCTYEVECSTTCAVNIKEELIQTLECIGGTNAKWNWMFLGEKLFGGKY